MTEQRSETIGFIGLGNMGANMALCLRKVGYRIVIHDLNPSTGATLISEGAEWAENVQECARQADILITSLPKPDNVRTVMSGDTGALASLAPGSLWVDMTTNDVTLVHELADEARNKSVSVIDAPVTGAVDGARTASLTIFVGGADDDCDRARPVLEAMGKIIRCGQLGTGNAVKLVTNYLWFTHAAVIGEGLLMGKQAGVPLDVLWDAIKLSVGDSFVARHDVPSIFAGHYDPSFSLGLCVKDLGLCEQLAARGGVPTAVGDAVAERFRLARDTYGENAGELHVARLLEEAVGTDLRLEGDFTPHWEA